MLEKITDSKLEFCQENSVKSKLNVLRGLHFQRGQYAQSKLISVESGKILDIAVDIRRIQKLMEKTFLIYYPLINMSHYLFQKDLLTDILL